MFLSRPRPSSSSSAIVDKYFPKNHPLNKIFNRHTLKLSYSCMPNMKTIIASHNKQILSNVATTPNQKHDPNCNCRKKAECPLDGKCLQPGSERGLANDGNNNRIVRGTGIKLFKKDDTETTTHSFRNANRRNATEIGRRQNISH